MLPVIAEGGGEGAKKFLRPRLEQNLPRDCRARLVAEPGHPKMRRSTR